jgi:hypothetical protein
VEVSIGAVVCEPAIERKRVQAIGDAVADAVDRRRFLHRQGGLELQRIARSAGKPAADGCCRRVGSCAALRAFLRMIRGPRRPFWRALHDDRGSTPIRRDRRRQRSRVGGARRSEPLLGARRCAFTPRPSKNGGGGENENFRESRASMTKIKFNSRRRRQWNSLAKWGRHRRALVRDSVRFLQRFEFF